MSKKKIIAIILFIFLCLFMFTYAGPGNLELKDIKDSKEPIEDQNKDNNNDKDNKDNIKDDSKENIKVVVKNAPEIIVEPYKVVILYGDDYYIMSGVSLNGEEKLSIKADITSTKELKVGQHIVTYTAEDKNGNKATATRKIIVLDPQGDEDKDGFTNEEEIKNDDPKDPFDPESHPETIAPTIKLLGSNPYRMAVNTKYLEEFVEITLDPHDLITTLDDVKVEGKVDNKTIGEYVITYTIVDRYKKSASVSRTVKVLEDKNNNGIIDEDENHYTIDFECEGRGHLNGTLTYSDILVDLTFDEAQIIIPEAVADTYYELKRWEPLTPNGNTKVIGNATYKAVFGPINDLNNNGIADEEEAHYTVKFEAGLNGSLTGTTVYENILTGLTLKEANVVSPTVIPNAGYKFDGWEPEVLDNTKVTSNLTYTAKYVVDDSTVLTGIILKENPNAQLMFQKNTNINIKDYVYVLKVYKDNHTVVANKDEYVINGFSTSKVGTYQITATLNNLLSNSLNYKIVEESAYPTKFEVKFNDTNKYRETKNSFCTGNCDSIQNTNEVVLDHNFIEITEHYDENIKISNIVVRYTNNTTKSINNKLVLSDSVRWSRVDGLNQYDPVYILESYSSKKEHLLLPTDYTYDNIMTSNIIIDTLDITYTKDNKYTYTITFKYDIASKTFKAIKEV